MAASNRYRAALSTFSAALRLRKGTRGSMNGMIELPSLFAGALVLLVVALFAAMIWAGNHQH
jgi:hypothetical protein